MINKYTIIAKTGYRENEKWVKYHFDDTSFERLMNFLIEKYDFKFGNIFNNNKNDLDYKKQVGYVTKSNPHYINPK